MIYLANKMETPLRRQAAGASNRAQTTYRPTQKALDMLPVVFAIMHWGLKYNPNTDMSIPIMQELKQDEEHLKQRLMGQFSDIVQ
jgi:DNA-binding HxlR family transcriptional regulator